MARPKQPDSTDSLVSLRLQKSPEDTVFTPADFADLGTSQAVRHALTRLTEKGTLRRLARGLYDVPRKHPKLGNLAASPEAIAKALQSRDASRLQPTGAYAANLLGLSEQVPAKIVFFTDGRPRTVQVGNQQIVLKKRSSRAMATAGRMSGLVIHALDYLGKDKIDDDIIKQLQSNLSSDDRRKLLDDARYAPAWIADTLRNLAEKAEQ